MSILTELSTAYWLSVFADELKSGDRELSPGSNKVDIPVLESVIAKSKYAQAPKIYDWNNEDVVFQFKNLLQKGSLSDIEIKNRISFYIIMKKLISINAISVKQFSTIMNGVMEEDTEGVSDTINSEKIHIFYHGENINIEKKGNIEYNKVDIKKLSKRLHDAKVSQHYMDYRFLNNYKIKAEVDRLNEQWSLMNPEGETDKAKKARHILHDIVIQKNVTEKEALIILKNIFHIE